MLYLSLTDNSLELLETKKGLIGDEKFVSVSRKLLKEKVIELGLITDSEGLLSAFREALTTAYPKEIKEKQISLVLPGDQVVIKRFAVPLEVKVTPDWIIKEAGKYLPQDISHYESYFKEISGKNGKIILFTALPLSLILSYHHLFSRDKIKINFLSVAPFSVYAFLRQKIAEGETCLYADLDKHEKYYLLDYEGPVTVFHKKSTGKLITDLKSALKKLDDEKLKPSRIYLAGEKSLEAKIEELSETLSLPVEKMSQLISDNRMQILPGQTMDKIDTGGVPLFYFDKTFGLINLTKLSDVPNFASDLKLIEERYQKTASAVIPADEVKIPVQPAPETKPMMETVEVTSKEETVVAEEKSVIAKETEKIKEEPLISENIVEYKRSQPGMFLNKFVWFVIALALGLLTVGGFLVVRQKGSISLPFLASPTVTATLTAVPTVTPTPTIDAALKRKDLTVSVLNGTDKSGFARTTADKLEKDGYTLGTVGNAGEDSKETIVRIKESKKNFLPLLFSDLKEEFPTVKTETLPSDDKADAVLILGQ